MAFAHFSNTNTRPESFIHLGELAMSSSFMDMNNSLSATSVTFLTTALLGSLVAAIIRGSTSSSYLPLSEIERICLALFSQQFLTSSIVSTNKTLVKKAYRWDRSTHENYQSRDGDRDHGRYASIRKNIDKHFHGSYSAARSVLQDDIIDSFLNDPSFVNTATAQERPWVVFTAGAMGAGKSHTMNMLHTKGRFPLDSFITVDPDSIRQQLPEFPVYVARNPETAGYLTRKECGMIAEILTRAALQRGFNILVDGSLRNASWYEAHFEELRRVQPGLKIAILHVTAPAEAVYDRAEKRAKVTGRVVPRDLLAATLQQVPQSVERLAPLADYSAEILNHPDADDVTLVGQDMDWRSFRQQWD
jgi:predicted kinase